MLIEDRIPYSPIIERPKISWPGDARVAVWVAPNVEHTEFLPPPSKSLDPWPRVAHPDIQQYAFHDYGNRVAFWRMLSILDDLDVRCTVSLNLGVLDLFPEIAEAMISRNWAMMCHGLFNTRYIYGDSDGEVRALLEQCQEIYGRHVPGGKLRGLLGPAVTATENTADILASLGFDYYVDWIHDDQPFPLRVAEGRLVSLPYSFELNDGPLLKGPIEGPEWAAMCKAQFDRLYLEGKTSGRVMSLSVHPFRIAQPHRARYFREVLEHITAHEAVWMTTADDIAEHYLANHYDDALRHAESLTYSGTEAV